MVRSFLVRHDDYQGGTEVLSVSFSIQHNLVFAYKYAIITYHLQLKYFNTQLASYEYMNYKVKTDGQQVWFSSRHKFNNLSELVNFCMENKAEEMAAILTNICLLPNPHSDPIFAFHNKDHDSLRVPISELELGNC